MGRKYAETALGHPWGCPLRREVTDWGGSFQGFGGLVGQAAGRTLQLEDGEGGLQVRQAVISQEGL